MDTSLPVDNVVIKMENSVYSETFEKLDFIKQEPGNEIHDADTESVLFEHQNDQRSRCFVATGIESTGNMEVSYQPEQKKVEMGVLTVVSSSLDMEEKVEIKSEPFVDVFEISQDHIVVNEIKHEIFNEPSTSFEIEDITRTVENAATTCHNPFQNPWPHLERYFKLSHPDKQNNKILYFECQICLPVKKVINVHVSTLSNLKSHFKRTHPTLSNQFEYDIKVGSNRGKRRLEGTIHELQSKKDRQHTLSEALSLASSGALVHQSTVDKKIISFFVTNILPLHVVESEEFIDLIRTLNPTKVSMSRYILGKYIDAQQRAVEETLISTFDGLTYLATTADCWIAHNRYFLGMTAHWIDPITRARKHAVLICTHLIGSNTYNAITKNMVRVHERFNIQDKVVRTTTDNGSNFIKSFPHYGAKVELLPDYSDLSNVAELPDTNLDNETDSTEDDDAINMVALGEYLDEEQEHPNLPVYMRCAAHTFNLVASVDLGTYLLNQTGSDIAVFNTLNKKALGKALALFAAQGMDTQIGDAIQKALGRSMLIPGKTAWNAMYDSIAVLNNILTVASTKDELNNLLECTEKLAPFSDQEIAFLKEWTKVMSHVAIAISTIKEERNAYFGTLLPTVAITLMKLRNMRSRLAICKPLADALVAAISNRFNHFLNDRDCQLAAAFHPKFRLHWLRRFNRDQTIPVRAAMEDEVERELRNQNIDSSDSSSDSSMSEDLFSGWVGGGLSGSVREKARRLVDTWLDTDGKVSMVDTDFMGEEVFIKLFLKFNTPIPASAGVEQLFSLGKGILGPNISSLASGAEFEKLVFLKGNQHIVTMS